MEALEYKERMMDYYPPVVKNIKDIKAIIDVESEELSNISKSMSNVLDNAYILTMDENRLSQWEKILGVRVLSDSTIDERRDVVIARLRGQGKLNTNTINEIVHTFTGGSANSWFENSTLYVEITPSPTNKQYRFENIENELKHRIPCHLGLEVIRRYYTWDEVKNTNDNWNEVKNNFDNWEDVLLHVEG